MKLCRAAACCTLLALICMSISACDGLFSDGKARHRGKGAAEKYSYQPATFVEQATLARIAFEQGGTPEASTLKALDGLTVKPQDSALQRIVTLVYRRGGDKTLHKVVAPLPVGTESASLPALLNILEALGKEAFTVQDVQTSVTSVQPPSKLKLAASRDNAGVRRVLDRIHASLLSKAQKLPALEESKTQAQLARFFMNHRFRDAAYIALDNAKQALAVATRNRSASPEALEDTSKSLAALEAELREKLPFTL